MILSDGDVLIINYKGESFQVYVNADIEKHMLINICLEELYGAEQIGAYYTNRSVLN